MKVTFFIHDLAANPVVRAEPLMRAAEAAGHEVEAIGFLISGPEVFGPYRNKRAFKTIRAGIGVSEIMGRSRELASLATGEAVYACKPLLTSFFPALLASGFGRRKPLFLDVEDDDVWAPDGSDNFSGFINFYIRGFKRATCCKWGLMLHPFTRLAKGTTVSSRKLQNRYGGIIVRHGPDERDFDPDIPALQNRAAIRRELGIPPDKPVMLFAGIPHPHKGVGIIMEALKRTEAFDLVLCGPPENAQVEDVRQRLGSRCHFIGLQPNDEMPRVLAACDVAPVLQRAGRYCEAQLPAKLLEAMAMAKLVVATRVGDLPEILGEGAEHPRGWVISPEDPAALSRVLDEISALPDEARQARALAARKWYLENASVRANAEILGRVLGKKEKLETGGRKPEGNTEEKLET